MAYADECFYFDYGNRQVKLEDSSDYTFKSYDSLSLRMRHAGKGTPCERLLSIELWGKEKDDGEREEDAEILLTRDNAMLLATKLQRAVAELDAIRYRAEALEELNTVIEVLGDDYDKRKDMYEEAGYSVYGSPKGGIAGAVSNYLDTPLGQDQIKRKWGVA